MARFASVLAGLFSIIVLFKILKQFKTPNKAAVFGVFAMIAIPAYHSVFRYARPESWAILFVLLSLFFFIKYMQILSKKSIFLTGLFCALGFLTHPFTLSVSLAIGLMLIIHSLKNKRIIPLIVFTIPVFVSMAIFILNSILFHGRAIPYSVLQRINTFSLSLIIQIHTNLKYILKNFIMDKSVIYFVPLIFLLLIGLFIKKKIV